MCGISGFIDFSKVSEQKDLEKMNATIRHRGPDGEGYFFDKSNTATIGLAHKRLSIIDLSETGAQPMQYDDLIITYNGEIYNHEEIGNELLALGHEFKGHSDTEVLLHAYEEWGLDATLEKCRGMFAFVLKDSKKNLVYFVRDRVGVKPLYIYSKEDIFLFSSELKAFLPHPSFHKEVNKTAVKAYFKLGYVPTPLCIYNNTEKVKPGTYHKLDLKSKQIEKVRYWNAETAFRAEKVAMTNDEIVSKTQEILNEVVALRLVSDVPVGVFLSGGYDSSLVAALAKQQYKVGKLKTFTIGFEDQKYNEATYAKQIAAHLDTDHRELYCTNDLALKLVNEIPDFYDEPFGDSSSIPTMLVSEFAAKYVTVSLSADAGDELFAGYNKYDQLLKLHRTLKYIPNVVKRPLAKLISANGIKKAIRLVTGVSSLDLNYKIKKLATILRAKNEYDFNRILGYKYFEDEIDNLIPSSGGSMAASDSRSGIGLLDEALLSDYETYLTDDIMTKVDRATMRSSLEGREPFLDHKLFEFVARLPIGMKYNAGDKKHILKEITHRLIPKKLLDRPKKGFSIPINDWMANEFKAQFLALTSPQYIKEQGIFNLSEIERLSNGFYNDNNEKAEKIWILFMFQLWYDRWMNS